MFVVILPCGAGTGKPGTWTAAGPEEARAPLNPGASARTPIVSRNPPSSPRCLQPLGPSTEIAHPIVQCLS
jgi:hypothetical protein